MNTPAFTTDPKRITRLQSNYDAGANREKMPCDVREREECHLVAPSPDHIQRLFAHSAALQKERTDVIQARKDQKAAQLAA